MEQRLDRLETQRTAPDPQAQARADHEERELVAQMSPDEQSRYWFDKGRREFGGAFNQLRGELNDRLDRDTFTRDARTDRARQRLEPEVERVISEARRNGNFGLSRTQVFHLMLGQEVDRKRQTAAPGQQRQAQRRVERETTRPGSPRGEATRGGRRDDDSVEAARERTRGVPL